MSEARRDIQANPRDALLEAKDALSEGHRDFAILSIVSLRQQKALYLYHLIREYKLLRWWD